MEDVVADLITLATNSTAPPDGSPSIRPGKEQQEAGLGILLQIMMLVLSFVIGHVLRRHRFYFVPEASASLLIGLFYFLFFKCINFYFPFC